MGYTGRWLRLTEQNRYVRTVRRYGLAALIAPYGAARSLRPRPHKATTPVVPRQRKSNERAPDVTGPRASEVSRQLVSVSGVPSLESAGSLRDATADVRDATARDRDHASDERDLVSDQRDEAADLRDRAGEHRDRVADLRDRASSRRDSAADLRDDAAHRFEASLRPAIADDALLRLGRVRAQAASDREVSAADRGQNAGDRHESASARVRAGQDRSRASTDRDAGDTERGQAQTDRDASRVDRDESAGDRAAAHYDDLTGAYRRGSGLLQLERDVARASRTGLPLAVAFVDVDHLKVVNDSQGHAAGDRLLCHVSDALRSSLRPYDLVIRYGGDEFLCVMDGLDAGGAQARLASVNATLEGLGADGSVSWGVSELQGPRDSASDLIRRADEALYRGRDADRS